MPNRLVLSMTFTRRSRRREEHGDRLNVAPLYGSGGR